MDKQNGIPNYWIFNCSWIKMELHNKDFGKDRSVQYKETIREENEKIRKSLVKIQEKNLKN